ncbi:MAG: hypothetical protein ACHQ01_05215 [Candidatus Limnocylindrales bacterium]
MSLQMDDFDTQDLMDEAVAIGLANAQVLALAAAWCQNLGVTKGPMGTGYVEVVTGLPISGGSLRCEFAKAPTVFGMDLQGTSIAFYEANCVGCPHHKPTGTPEHLGTWADKVIADRREQERRLGEERERAAEARRQRASARRMVHGAPDAALQSILDLVDRVDAENTDREAEALLLAHAEMAPYDFPDALLDHLVDEAMAIGTGALIESVVAIFERQGRPSTDRMLEVAFAALDRGVGRRAAGRVIAAHADRFDAGEGALRSIVQLASGEIGRFPGRTGDAGEPAALIRFYDVDRDLAVRVLSDELQAAEPWRRAVAANAADKLIGVRPRAGRALLSPLLDSISLTDKSRYAGDPFAAGKATNVVADIFVSDPEPVSREIDVRFAEADARYSKKLWRCYDNASRARLREDLPAHVATTIARRAVSLLRENRDPDFLRDVAETLDLVTSYHGSAIELSLSEMMSLVCEWGDRVDAYAETRPTDDAITDSSTYLRFLEWDSARIRTSTVLSKLEAALKQRVKLQPREFAAMLGDSWDDIAASRSGRSSLVAGLEVINQTDDLVAATPLLLRVLGSDRPLERGDALRAIERIGDHGLTLPSEIGDGVLAALQDTKLYVIVGAIRALRHVIVPADVKQNIVVFLIEFGRAYQGDRLRADDIERAVYCALELATGEPYEDAVGGEILKVVAGMPASEAAALLGHLPLRQQPAWPATVLHALRDDEDPNYYGLNNRERQHLLASLVEQPTERIAPFFDELQGLGTDQAAGSTTWTWAIADVLARLDQHERAANVCDAVVTAMPDTREYGPRRRFARRIALSHHLDAAAVAGDAGRTTALLVEVDSISHVVDE